MRTILAVALLLLAEARIAAAQSPPPGGPPIYHGLLDIAPAAHGVLNRVTGDATLSVRRWRYIVAEDTNGLAPDQERLVIAVGSGQNDFYLPPGSLESRRGGRLFRYVAPRGTTGPGIRTFRMVKRPDGNYRVSFRLVGVELGGLNFNDPICVPLAVIVGDDDGFSTADASSPNFNSPRVKVASGTCKAGWPWLGN